MYGRIILGHDGTEQSRDAFALARLLASDGNRSVVVSHIIPRPPPFDARTREYVKLVQAHDHSVLDPALAELAGLRAEGRALESASPARGLHELAEDEGFGRARHPAKHRSDGDGSVEEELDRALADVQAPDAERVMLSGGAAKCLAEACTDSDLLIVGSRSYGPLHHTLLGSVSAQLMRAGS